MPDQQRSIGSFGAPATYGDISAFRTPGIVTVLCGDWFGEFVWSIMGKSWRNGMIGMMEFYGG